MTTPGRFEQYALKSVRRLMQTYCQRGDQYGDTWGEARWLAMQAVGRKVGLDLTNDQCRLLAAAALVDVKYWRLLGGYKDDTVIDGMAYAALLASEMEEA